ncbi:hypothetical protein GCM10022393_14450 [Aquimarina addita]|uniref:VIT domain-containing protein n=1 Tax=Aquimarina addita TaxID=870485 RepID=A0ABP7XFR6_9FLAO
MHSISILGQAALIKMEEDEGISIKEISIEAKIIGDIGITTYTIEVFNNLDMQLSGELQFPLSDHQTIIGYSLDIDGTLRKAVGVDKTKGQTAYEEIVSRGIDPGLLEKTEGNNFKTRIYPIPAKGSRIIALEILDTFVWNQGGFEFTAMLDFKEKIDKKSVHIDFIGFSENLRLENISSFELKKEKGVISLMSDSTKNIAITIVPERKHFGFYQQYQDEYFYYTSVATPVSDKVMVIPQSINILWDCSRSRKGLVTKEIEFIKALAKKVKTFDINIILFNSSVVEEKNIKIRNGKTKKLEKFLTNIKYDGATQYGCINQLPNADINILCSDGLSNFGNDHFINTDIPTFTIASQTTINPSKLQSVARDNAGVYIHLENQSISSSVALMLYPSNVFSGYLEESIKEQYPRINAKVVSTQFRSIARGDKSEVISPKFRVNTSAEHVVIPIAIAKEVIDLKRMFVIQKVQELSLYPTKHKEQLLLLGLKYHLITDYTSLIVLETLEDYIDNEILPPITEWQQLYLDNLQLAKMNKELKVLDTKRDQVDELEDLLTWQFPEKAKEIEANFKKIDNDLEHDEDKLEAKYDTLEHDLDAIQSLNLPEQSQPIIDEPSKESGNMNAKVTATATLRDGIFLVTGTIATKADNMGLPGVNIIIKGTAEGTTTDFDGNFSIEVPLHSILVYQYIGYQTLEKEVVDGAHTEDFFGDQAQLDEIVVVGYGYANVQKYKNPDDFLKNAPDVDNYQVFRYGKELFIKKKENHVVLGANPLVFEDYEEYDFSNIEWEYGVDELEYLDWEDVFSLEIIPPLVATGLVGDLGRDGIIFVYTKDYVADDMIKIPIEINKYIDHRLSKKVWTDMPASLEKIQKYAPEKRYEKYMEITEKEKQAVGFYIIAGSLFAEDDPATASKIWSNIAEIQLDNQENIRTLAYQLRSIGRYKEAIPFFEKILELRPDQPIAYRDLAVTYSLDKKYLKAIAILENALDGDWIERNADPYDYVEVLNTLYNDYNNILKKKSDKVVNEYTISADLRVVLTWTSNDTDIDLHLITPSGDDFYYSNDESDTIRYNTDITDGFGPEEILVKTADKGTYTVLVDFYADREQTIHGPVGLTIEMYKYFGTEKEERTEKVLTLTKEADNVLGATIKF